MSFYQTHRFFNLFSTASYHRLKDFSMIVLIGHFRRADASDSLSTVARSSEKVRLTLFLRSDMMSDTSKDIDDILSLESLFLFLEDLPLSGLLSVAVADVGGLFFACTGLCSADVSVLAYISSAASRANSLGVGLDTGMLIDDFCAIIVCLDD